MILSRIIHLRNLLRDPQVCPQFETAITTLNAFMHYIATHDVKLRDREQALIDGAAKIRQDFVAFDDRIYNAIMYLEDAIQGLQPAYLEKSTNLYRDDISKESLEHILNRSIQIDPESQALLQAHVLKTTDWRLPGLIFRPARESHIETLVPMDPLYLADQSMSLLTPAIDRFTPEYQRRLRPYVVNDFKEGPILSDLPDNQFGLVFAYNYFNYKPIEVIRKYLNELFVKLRPGGTLIMTYNDCDYEHHAVFVEQGLMCYTPGRLIRQHAKEAGFEITFNHVGTLDVAWVELLKPGNIQSLRGGQTMAKILPK